MLRKKNYYVGLSFARVLMTFEVVLAHCMDWSNYNNPIYKIFKKSGGNSRLFIAEMKARFTLLYDNTYMYHKTKEDLLLTTFS